MSQKTECHKYIQPLPRLLPLESEKSCSNSPFTYVNSALLDQCPAGYGKIRDIKTRKYLDPTGTLKTPELGVSEGITRTFAPFYNKTQEFTILSFNIWNTNTVQTDSERGTLYKQRLKHIIKVSEFCA